MHEYAQMEMRFNYITRLERFCDMKIGKQIGGIFNITWFYPLFSIMIDTLVDLNTKFQNPVLKFFLIKQQP